MDVPERLRNFLPAIKLLGKLVKKDFRKYAKEHNATMEKLVCIQIIDKDNPNNKQNFYLQNVKGKLRTFSTLDRAKQETGKGDIDTWLLMTSDVARDIIKQKREMLVHSTGEYKMLPYSPSVAWGHGHIKVQVGMNLPEAKGFFEAWDEMMTDDDYKDILTELEKEGVL